MRPAEGPEHGVGDTRRRLAAVEAALELAASSGTGAAGPAPDRARAVLEERARALARPSPSAAAGAAAASLREVIVAHIGAGRYALPLERVVEVARAPALVPIPGSRPPATAVAAWRGRVLTVLQLAPGAGAEAGGGHHLLVVGESRAAFAVAVDAVEGVRSLAEDDVRPPPEGLALAHPDLTLGVTADAVVLLDTGALLQRYPRRG